jgi:hypothetical protein
LILVMLAAAAISGAPPMGQAVARPDQSTPQAAAATFYDTYLRSTAGAFPNRNARMRLRRLLSPRLNLLLERADHAQAEHARRSRGQEPPPIEGDVFTSLFEGAGRFQVERCRSGPMRAICLVSLDYGGGGQAPARWSDQLVLMRAPAGWVVDDVVYGGRWAFANRGRLSQTLRSTIPGG